MSDSSQGFRRFTRRPGGGRAAWRLAASLSILLVLAAAAGPAAAQETGFVSGTVVDSTTSKPIGYASVQILDTTVGANAKGDGTFLVRNVPVGTFRARGSFIGYEAVVRPVTVKAGETTSVTLPLHKKSAAGTTKKIVVLDTRPLVDVSEISTVRTTGEKEIKSLPVDSVDDIVTRQVGVSGEGDQMHVRGGRSDETLFRIESVAMKNAVTGAPVGGSLSAKAVQEVQVVTGGYQAERGQAISGVVDVELKEATQERVSTVTYEGGSFDTERLFLQTAGSEPITMHLLPKIGLKIPGTVGLLIGADLLSTDTYLPSRRNATNFTNERRTLLSNYSVNILGLSVDYDDILRLRQKNGLNMYAKINWKATSRHKVNLTFTRFAGEDHGFERYRIGDDVADASSSSTPYRYDFKDQMDQYPTFTEDTNAQILNWKYAISNQSYSVVTMSHFFNDVRQAVQGQLWYEYDPWIAPPPDTFFVADRNLDYPYFQDLYVDRWTGAGQYTRRWHTHHEFKAGLEASYYTLQMIDIRNPDRVQNPLGTVRDLYHVNPNDGAFFAQNQFKYEGFVGHIGLRADYLFLGEAADDAVNTRRNGMTESVAQAYLDHTHELFGNRFKLFWSPRLGINHPITDHDEMHFNFGHFIQWPRLTYYYAKIGSQSSEAFPLVGNLDLDPQRSVQFEFGVKHQIGDNDAVDVTFFNKDVYDYPIATRPVEATAQRLVYINDDFSRTRGLELVYRHRARKRFGGGLSYEYQIATGKPADPNRIKQVDPEALETGDAEPDLTEQYMPWNRPHRLQVDVGWRFAEGDPLKLFGLGLGDRWAANFYYTFRSGRPFTPTTALREPTGKRNSSNAPFENVLDAKFDKSFLLRGRTTLGLTLQIRNLLDSQILRTVDSSTGQAPVAGAGVYYFQSQDTEKDKQRMRDQLSNPAFYAEPRNLRLSMEVNF